MMNTNTAKGTCAKPHNTEKRATATRKNLVLVDSLDLETQAYTPMVMYLNGEYWGIYSLRQKMDEDFLALKYHCKKKQVTLVEADECKNGKKKEFKKLNTTISDLKDLEKEGDQIYEVLSKEIDMDNFIHYIFCRNLFCQYRLAKQQL